MLLKVIHSLKDIQAEHLLQNKSQPYAEGVESAWNTYNSIIMLASLEDAEMRVKMKLALTYADRENANNSAEAEFQTGMIDFYEYILDYES
jgi:hypothetical protein